MPKKNKVLIIDFTSFYGGGQVFVLNLQYLLGNEVDFHYAIGSSLLGEKLKSNQVLSIGSSWMKSLACLRSVNSYIRKNKIDVVLLNGNRSVYLAPLIRCSHTIAYKHTSNNALRGFKKSFAILMLNVGYFFCNKIILLYKAAVKEVWFDKNKVAIISNTIVVQHKPAHPTVLPPREASTVRISVISRLDKNKGLQWLLNVYKQLDEVIINKTELYIAGDGELLDELNSFVKQNNLTNTFF